MDWTEILTTIVTALLGLVGTALVGLATWGVKKLVDWLKSKTAKIEDDDLRATLDYLFDGIEEVILDAVKSVEYKLTSTWTDSDTDKAIEIIKASLTDEDLNYIYEYEIAEKSEEALNEYLKNKIYATLEETKEG